MKKTIHFWNYTIILLTTSFLAIVAAVLLNVFNVQSTDSFRVQPLIAFLFSFGGVGILIGGILAAVGGSNA